MQIDIPYGQGFRTVSFDQEHISVLQPKKQKPAHRQNEVEIVKKALSNVIDSAPLSVLAKGKHKIVVVTSDHTRPVPSQLTLPLILDEIRKGNPSSGITILVATGAHRETTASELESKFGKELLKKERFVVHHAHVETENIPVGFLSDRRMLKINKTAQEADLLIAEGFIEPHFFAGFSGGRKSILPGISDIESVCANHSAARIDHPLSRTGILEGNPVHREMLEAAKLAKLVFILNVILDGDKKVISAFAGDPGAAHIEGCKKISGMFSVTAGEADIVVTGNGGYPLDQNIYQSVKGMTTAETVCRKGGVIIMLAECSDGDGGKSFSGFFNNEQPVEDLYNEILKTPAEKTKADQWQAQILMRILKRCHVILVSSLSKPTVEKFRMIHASSFDEAYRTAKNILHIPSPSINVIPDGISVIVSKNPYVLND